MPNNKTIDPKSFYFQFFYQGRLHPSAAPEYFRVNRTTFMRWQTGQARIPWTAYRCAELDLAGTMPIAAGPDWSGWRFIGGKLVSPENQCFSVGEIRNIPWQYTIEAGLRRELRLTTARESALTEQLRAVAEKSTLAETA